MGWVEYFKDMEPQGAENLLRGLDELTDRQTLPIRNGKSVERFEEAVLFIECKGAVYTGIATRYNNKGLRNNPNRVTLGFKLGASQNYDSLDRKLREQGFLKTKRD